MKKRLLAGLLATSIALSISMGAFPAMAATNDDFVEDREDIADYTDDSYSSGYSSSEQLFDDIIFFDLDEEVDDTAAEVIAEEDANDSSDTEIDRAADSIEETEPEDEVQNTDSAEDRNDREYPDEETKSGTNPGEAGPSDAETEEDVPDSWEETPKIDSELEAAIASEDPFSYYDDDASEEEMDDDIALLAAGKTMAHEDYAYTDVSSGTEYMVDLYTDHTAKIWKLITSSGGAECILPSTIYYTDDDGVPEPTPYTVTELHLSYWSGVTSDNNNYTALVLPDTLTDIGGSLSGFKNVTEITIPGSVKVFNATLQNMKQLKTLTFDEGVDEIASGSVVSGCKSLTTIHLPSSLQKTLRDGHVFRRIGADGYHAPGRHCDHRGFHLQRVYFSGIDRASGLHYNDPQQYVCRLLRFGACDGQGDHYSHWQRRLWKRYRLERSGNRRYSLDGDPGSKSGHVHWRPCILRLLGIGDG